MEADLKALRIDRSKKVKGPSKWAAGWIVGGILLLLLLGAGATPTES